MKKKEQTFRHMNIDKILSQLCYDLFTTERALSFLANFKHKCCFSLSLAHSESQVKNVALAQKENLASDDGVLPP